MPTKFLYNLLVELILKNKFIINKLPFLGENIKNYDHKILVKMHETNNLFDISLCMAKFPTFVRILKEHSDELVRPIFKRKLTSCIQDRGEGDADDEYFEAIHDFINLMRIKRTVFVVNSSVNADDLYEKFLIKHNYRRRAKFIGCPEDFGNGSVEIDGIKIYQHFEKIQTDFNRIDDKKLFCNFNLKARLHRSGMIAILHYHDLLFENHVTTPCFHIKKEFTEQEWIILLNHTEQFLSTLKEKDKILSKLESLKSRYPLRIDQRVNHLTAGSGLADSLIYNARKDSLFEVVSETIVTGSHFFTEKVYMPIALCKPFILISSFESLKSLKLLGYQTFHPYINEEYDLIEDSAERCMAIAKELVRLKTLRVENPKLFRSNYEKMIKIAEENREVLFSK